MDSTVFRLGREARVSQYLSSDEADLLRSKLEAVDIPSLKTCFGFLRFKNYSVYVAKRNEERAGAVVAEFNREVEQKRLHDRHELTVRCPVCKAEDIYAHEKKSIIDRIRFIGVSVWRCRVCGSEWYT